MDMIGLLSGRRTKELFDPELKVTLRAVDDNKVRHGVLGQVEFDKKRITFPTFRNVLDKVNAYAKSKFVQAAEGLSYEILDHERTEYLTRPEGPDEHAKMDAYRQFASETPWGIILHYIGLETGRKFTEQVNRYFPVKDAYRSLENVYGSDSLEEMTDAVKKLVGRKDLDPEEAYGWNCGLDNAADFASYRPQRYR